MEFEAFCLDGDGWMESWCRCQSARSRHCQMQKNLVTLNLMAFSFEGAFVLPS